MKRVLTGGLLLSGFLFANCTKAEQIFADSRDESNLNQKIDLIKKAKTICPNLAQISIEMERLEINYLIKKEQLQGLEIRLSTLNNKTDTTDSLPYEFRFNTKRQIQEMFKSLYTKQKNMRGKKSFNSSGANISKLDEKLASLGKKLNTSDMKSLEDVGGLYHSNLKFLKNSSTINNLQEAKVLKAKMREIMSNHSDTLFSVTGYASSEGKASYNENLSAKRAKSFVVFVGQNAKHIKSFSKGEGFLVCKDGLIAEMDENYETRCINGEDRDASRRVEIRRVR